MFKQNSINHALAWFIVQINGLRDQIPTANFSDVDFLHNANILMSEITSIDIDIYVSSYQNGDNYAVAKMLGHVKKEAQRIRHLLRRVALEITVQPNDKRLLNHILVSLQSLSISLLQLNKELESDYYLSLFSYSQSNAEEIK